MGAAVYFADVRRERRGYYRLRLRPLTDEVEKYADYTLTDLYMRELEAMIRRQPAYWLWTHRRWKHKRAPQGAE